MSDGLAYLPVGSDRYRAHLIAEACRAEGIRVELLTGDDNGMDPFWGIVQPHRLLVAARDVERVESVIADWTPGVTTDP